MGAPVTMHPKQKGYPPETAISAQFAANFQEFLSPQLADGVAIKIP